MRTFPKYFLSLSIFLFTSLSILTSALGDVYSLMNQETFFDSSISKNEFNFFHLSSKPTSDTEKICELEVLEIEEQEENNTKSHKKLKVKKSFYTSVFINESKSELLYSLNNIHSEYFDVPTDLSNWYISFSRYIGYI